MRTVRSTCPSEAASAADACAASLVGVHLGRVNRAGDGRDRLEVLVVEA
jgi:hypothetical protein